MWYIFNLNIQVMIILKLQLLTEIWSNILVHSFVYSKHNNRSESNKNPVFFIEEDEWWYIEDRKCLELVTRKLKN